MVNNPPDYKEINIKKLQALKIFVYAAPARLLVACYVTSGILTGELGMNSRKNYKKYLKYQKHTSRPRKAHPA